MPAAHEVSVLSSFDVTAQDIQSIREVGRLLDSDMDAVLDELHDWLVRHDAFRAYFGAGQRVVDRVVDAQRHHWHGLAHIQMDEAYLASRRHVGALYQHLQLPLEIHCALMSRVQQLLSRRLLALQPAPGQLDALLASLAKFIHLDTYLSLDEMARIQRQKSRANEPLQVTPTVSASLMWAGVLLLRLPGALDAAHAQDSLVKVLTQVSQHRAKVLVVDIDGLMAIEPEVVRQWVRLAKATRLMGCEALFAGMTPAVAQAIVASGIGVDGLRTTATLRDACETALGMVGDPHGCLGDR
jgi:rsbT co-antagonist protein RsbR